MNKKFQIMMLIFFALGFLTLSLSSIFRNHLTDFELGFCKGISIIFIITGFTYICWCLFNGKNPYKVEG